MPSVRVTRHGHDCKTERQAGGKIQHSGASLGGGAQEVGGGIQMLQVHWKLIKLG